MEITAELLRSMLPEMTQQRDVDIRQLGAIEGAIIFCEKLIGMAEKEEQREGRSAPPEKD